MAFHYEIVFFKPKNICGKNIIKWSASGETFTNQKDAVCYAEKIKAARQVKEVSK